MTPAAFAKRLAALGATPEAVAFALEQVEKMGAERRKKNAARQRRWRARRRNVTPTERDNTSPSVEGTKPTNKASDVTLRNVTNAPLLSSIANPLTDSPQRKEELVEGRDTSKQKKRGLPLPDDFRPKGQHYDFARIDLGRPREFADECCAEMRDWAAAERHRPITLKSDWDKALFNWMRKAAKTGPPRANGHKVRPQTLREETADVLKSLDPSDYPRPHDHRAGQGNSSTPTGGLSGGRHH